MVRNAGPDDHTAVDEASTHDMIGVSAEAVTNQTFAHHIRSDMNGTKASAPNDEANAMPSAQKADEDADLPGVIAVDGGEEDEIDFDDDFDDGFDDEKDIIAFFTQPEEAGESDCEDEGPNDEGPNDEDTANATKNASAGGAFIEELGATPPITGTSTSASPSPTVSAITSTLTTAPSVETYDVAAPENVA